MGKSWKKHKRALEDAELDLAELEEDAFEIENELADLTLILPVDLPVKGNQNNWTPDCGKAGELEICQDDIETIEEEMELLDTLWFTLLLQWEMDWTHKGRLPIHDHNGRKAIMSDSGRNYDRDNLKKVFDDESNFKDKIEEYVWAQEHYRDLYDFWSISLMIWLWSVNRLFARLAQLAEHRFCKPTVVSSNLTSGSNFVPIV